MSVAVGDGPVVDGDGRRARLESAFLSVQRERVALTASFMRLGEGGAAGVEALIVRLLRLQRVVEMAHSVTLATEPTRRIK